MVQYNYRKGEGARPQKDFQKNLKKGLTNSTEYGTIKMSRGEGRSKRDAKKLPKKIKKTLDKPPKVWYNKYRKGEEKNGAESTKAAHDKGATHRNAVEEISAVD